jgi:EAL domain-containing protein (putative c-di-GMP-specific phosphodiesterase class I)
MTSTFSSGLETVSADERCTRCEVLPRVAPYGAGRLHLGLPVAFVLRKARAAVAELSWASSENAGIIAIDVPAGEFPNYCSSLVATFTPVEREEIRALFVPVDHAPGIADFLEADSLQRVCARANAGRLLETLDGHLTSAFQPIVDAPTLEIFGYEALLRTGAGAPVNTPAAIFEIARGTDLLPHTDLAARRTAIACAAAAGITQRLFINFCPSAIYDPKTCLRSTIEALDAAGISHDRVIFEVIESDEVEDPAYLIEILKSYRQAGFKVALDDLGAGFASLNLLHILRPDFIKLDIALVRDIDSDSFKAMLAVKIIEAARALEMIVVAEGIETAAEMRWLRDNGAHLLQGFYLARPTAVPATVISAAARG